jgi:hypothetical protein
MAREIYAFSVSVAPGSTQNAPQRTNLSMPFRRIEAVEIVVPDGLRGQVGFALGAAGVAMIPVNSGQWIVTNDEKIHWPLEDQITSGAWQLIAYNLGVFTHILQIRFLVQLTQPAAALPSGLVPLTGTGADLGLAAGNGAALAPPPDLGAELIPELPPPPEIALPELPPPPEIALPSIPPPPPFPLLPGETAPDYSLWLQHDLYPLVEVLGDRSH